jgi:hypothetical protein
MAPVRRRTSVLLVVAGLLLVGVAGLAWFAVREDSAAPGGAAARGATTTAAAPAAGEAGPTTAPGAGDGQGSSPTGGDGGGGPGTSGPPAPPAPSCADVLSRPEATAALGAQVARVESRDGFLVRSCIFWGGADRYLLVQVSRGVAASREQYELSRLPGDRTIAGIGQAARWTRDSGLIDVLDGDARFQVGLFTGAPAGAQPPARLEAAARAVAAHL